MKTCGTPLIEKTMAGLNFVILGDNSPFLKALAQTQERVKQTSKQIEKEGSSIDQVFQRIAKGAAAIGLGFSATQLINDIIRVRGEFQQLEIAFETMLRSREKAATLMSELTETAAKTPFDLQSISQGAKQLLAYGSEAETVIDELKMLGNVASGVSAPLNDLVYLYGTLRSQGRAYTVDIRQFAGRGIPIYKELSNVLGVTTGELNGLIEAGKVGFPEVEKAFKNMTSSGGQFYNLMERQSTSLTGQISNLGDAWDMMLNEIGTKTQDIASTGISAVSSLVENYDKVGKALVSIAATYGTYRAALVAARLMENASAAARLAHIKIIQRQIAAQTALNLVSKANPYVLLATAVVGVATAMWTLRDSTSAAEKAQRRYNDERQKFLDREEERRQKIEELIRIIQDETETEYAKIKAYEELGTYSPALVEAYNREQIATLELAKSQKVLNEERDKMNYQYIISNIDKAKKSIQEYTKARQEASLNPRSNNQVAMYTTRIEQAEEDLRSWQTALNEYNRLKKQAEEDAKPVEVKLVEAKADLVQIENEFAKAKQKLEEEQGKIEDNPFYVIPFNIQLDFNNAQKALKEQRQKVAFLESQTSDGGQTYKAAYDEAKKTYEARLQALKDAKNGTKAEYVKAAQELEEAEKAYNDLGGVTGSATTKQDNQSAKIREQQQQLLEIQVKNAKDYARELKDLYFTAEQSRVDAMQESNEKTLAQMELNHKRELLELERQKEDFLQKKRDVAKDEFDAQENIKYAQNPSYHKASFDGSVISLSSEESTLYDNQRKSILDRHARELQEYYNAEKKSMNDYLAAYGDYYQKRNAIIAQGEERKQGKNEWEQKAIDEETKRILSDLDIEANKQTSAISKLFDDMREQTVADMRAIADAAEEAFQFLQSGTWDESKGIEFGMSKETFDTLRKSPEELERIRKGIEEVRKEADQSDTAFNKMAIGLEKVFNSGGNRTKLLEGLDYIQNGLNDTMQAAGFLSDTLSNLGDAFGSDALSGVAEGINVAMDAANSAMQGAQVGSMFGPIGAAAGAAVGLVSSLASSIAKIHDKKKEKQIQRLQDQIDTLGLAYDKLGRSIEKAYSTDAKELIEDQNKLLEQQKILIQQQIREEEDKKKTDDGRIKEWKQQIEEINQTIEDNKEKALEAITGTDIMSAIDEFAQAYADAWASGEDAAKASTDAVKKLIKTSLLEFLKKQLSPDVEEFMNKLGQFMSDGIIAPWEQAQLDQLKEKMDGVAENYFNQTEDYWKDDNTSTSEQQTASSRSFESMTQDQASELNGRFTALQEAGYQISDLNRQQLDVLLSILSLMPKELLLGGMEKAQNLVLPETPMAQGLQSDETIKATMSQVLIGVNALVISSDRTSIAISEIRNLMVTSTGYLEDISVCNQKMLKEFGAKMDAMNTKLNNL